jgi:hypothetical protein
VLKQGEKEQKDIDASQIRLPQYIETLRYQKPERSAAGKSQTLQVEKSDRAGRKRQTGHVGKVRPDNKESQTGQVGNVRPVM